ncbi:hypothetical protein SDC9_192344 [bioreactor metagenome]|uniref:Uncharacterized protein n=1 Tax=bioreactor metagenome TaxID=1076179 RepID=A0A645I2X9_9ZZZZ
MIFRLRQTLGDFDNTAKRFFVFLLNLFLQNLQFGGINVCRFLLGYGQQSVKVAYRRGQVLERGCDILDGFGIALRINAFLNPGFAGPYRFGYKVAVELLPVPKQI